LKGWLAPGIIWRELVNQRAAKALKRLSRGPMSVRQANHVRRSAQHPQLFFLGHPKRNVVSHVKGEKEKNKLQSSKYMNYGLIDVDANISRCTAYGLSIDSALMAAHFALL
jgi:hypothetical protein